MVHLQWIEDQRPHALREGLAEEINEQLLGDGDSAARIAELGAGQNVHLDARCICRRASLENLHNCRELLASKISGEAVNGQARSVTKKLPESNSGLPGTSGRHFP